MGHYIDKDALVAEIERRRSKNAKNKLNLAASFEDNYLLSFLDTLEVKEVDIDKEIANQYESNYEEYLTYEEFADIAKHFFELGIKAVQKEDNESLLRK